MAKIVVTMSIKSINTKHTVRAGSRDSILWAMLKTGMKVGDWKKKVAAAMRTNKKLKGAVPAGYLAHCVRQKFVVVR